MSIKFGKNGDGHKKKPKDLLGTEECPIKKAFEARGIKKMPCRGNFQEFETVLIRPGAVFWSRRDQADVKEVHHGKPGS